MLTGVGLAKTGLPHCFRLLSHRGMAIAPGGRSGPSEWKNRFSAPALSRMALACRRDLDPTTRTVQMWSFDLLLVRAT
jgi:hypothetical protein